MSLHIIGTDLFYDIEFHSWTSGGNGGGFSYTRTPAQLNSFEYPEDAVYFEKEDYADYTLEENQDRITADTWITRDNQQGIFNVFSEESYEFNYDDEVRSAPSNTLWAFGLTDQVSEGDYKPFKQAVQDSISMNDIAGNIFSMHIIGTDLFYDVEFHSWTCCGDGGGFSYTRTDQNGESVTITKEDYADYTLEENQDRITDDVWITRGDQNPLFNIAVEGSYNSSPYIYTNVVGSPENTEWSFGRTENLSSYSYQPWQAAIGGTNPSGSLNQFMSLHIISEDIYFDVVFHSWTCCGDGGGFSYTRIPVDLDTGPMVNSSISGTVIMASDSSIIEGAHIVAVSEDNSYSAETYSDSSGGYSLDVVGSLNYYVNISYDGLIDHNEYLFVAPFENTVLDVSLGILENALVEGTLTDWYTNAPLSGASVLFAYNEDGGDMVTIETSTDQSGYFMTEVPGEQGYDLFLYTEGYWVEHDAFFLSSGESQVLSIGIAPIELAARLYGTVKDFESGDLISYAQVQLNCDSGSDWDHTGELGTYRVFSYYPGDCDNGVLVVSASGYETSVQSVGSLDLEAGSSMDLDITLAAGNDPDPGMLSGTVTSNIDGSVIADAEIQAYNIFSTQLFSTNTSFDGSYQLFLPQSEYYISVNAENHQEFFDTLSVASGQSYIKDYNLEQVALHMVSGIISDQSGTPLYDIQVVALVQGQTIGSTFTNEEGQYELYLPNGIYDIGAGMNNYFLNFQYGIQVEENDVSVNITLEQVQQFDGGVAGLVHLNEGDSLTAWINIWSAEFTYNAYVSANENGAFTLPLINGTYNLYAWVPGSNYESIYIPNAFTIENNIINYDIYFIAPEAPEAPTIVFLGDIPNDQGGQMDLAWTAGDPQEYEIFPQYSVWRQDEDWTLLASVPYHGYDIYNMVVPTLGDSTDNNIVQSTFMVTAHTIDPNIFFDSDPATGYSVDNIFPATPEQLLATYSGETVELEWSVSLDEDFAYFNIYRQDLGSYESAAVFTSEGNYYTDEVGYLGEFEYWVTAVDQSGNESDPSEPATVTLALIEDLMPSEFALQQNYPNPFNPSTQIRYALPKSSHVKIVVYNMLGSKVRTLFDGIQDVGFRNVLWNATNDQGDPVSAGMYIYTIEANGYFSSKKMILLK